MVILNLAPVYIESEIISIADFASCNIYFYDSETIAYIGIFEGLSKLLIAFAISISTIDHLISYSALMCSIAIVVRFVYGRYCSGHFGECKFKLVFDNKQLKEMFAFAGWNFIGAIAGVLRDQGGNVILNLFCGPVVNAAKGISSQVNNAVVGFVTNFTMALNPQITQSYSAGNREYMQVLMYQGAKLAYFVLFLLSLPIIINTPLILKIWLGDYPDYADDLDDRRVDYYSAASIQRGVLELGSNRLSNQFDVLKEEIFDGVKDTARKSHPNGYERMLSVMEQAVKISAPNYLLSSSPYWISGKIKKGVCHYLVNDHKLRWVKKKHG